MFKKLFVIFLIFNIASISTMTKNSTAFDDGSETNSSCFKEEMDGCLLAINDMDNEYQNDTLRGEWLIQKEVFRCITNHTSSAKGRLLSIIASSKTNISEEAK
ncbi:MAG: hypothetical protein QCH96_02330 [Candidatus Thermoplasmatota archaeon]|nr:hypothetical protein [Candidatus Thermoplasmatota archaeon]